MSAIVRAVLQFALHGPGPAERTPRIRAAELKYFTHIHKRAVAAYQPLEGVSITASSGARCIGSRWWCKLVGTKGSARYPRTSLLFYFKLVHFFYFPNAVVRRQCRTTRTTKTRPPLLTATTQFLSQGREFKRKK